MWRGGGEWGKGEVGVSMLLRFRHAPHFLPNPQPHHPTPPSNSITKAHTPFTTRLSFFCIPPL